MIIAISGKIKSGKNLTGQIIQYLISQYKQHQQILEPFDINKNYNISDWQQKAFAGKLKQITSILTGCTVEQLESQEFKNDILSSEWDYVINGSFKPVNTKTFENDEVFKGNPNRFIKHYTYREILQKVGTEAMRDTIHENVWVNALFADYILDNREYSHSLDYPNWIITDMRFPNELNAVEERNGISIRIDRKREVTDMLVKRNDAIPLPNGRFQVPENDEIPKEYWGRIIKIQEYQYSVKTEIKFRDEHPSETALDNVPFKYRIDNNGTIEELIEKVKEILIKEKII